MKRELTLIVLAAALGLAAVAGIDLVGTLIQPTGPPTISAEARAQIPTKGLAAAAGLDSASSLVVFLIAAVASLVVYLLALRKL